MPNPVVVEGAILKCSGSQTQTPSVLAVSSQSILTMNDLAVATVWDNVPIDNVPPFGICKFLTALASGVSTPCVPAPAPQWSPGSKVQQVNGMALLTKASKLMCSLGGTIEISDPGQVLETSD